MTKRQRALLEAIAKEHLRIDSLDTRNSDSLDFYDRAVWCIESALQAAFEAGQETERKKKRQKGQ